MIQRDKWCLLQHTYNRLNFTKMKVELKVKKQSNVIAMSKCPEISESSCGIMYRMM